MSRLALLATLLLGGWLAFAAAPQQAHGCAFSTTPTAYEAARNRGAYLAGLEAAGYNSILPDDTFFGIPRVETGPRSNRTVVDEPYTPPILLKATGWIESALAQAAPSVSWQAVGPALVSFDCGHGIMQITSGMTSPADRGWPSIRQSLVATHFLYNIGRGAAILVEKWNAAPELRPVAGTDTDSDPTIVENWYFAVWGYNGFTGPGANRSNHPMDPDYQWPRTGFSCGPANDGFGHSYSNYPYQELVFGCASRPPSVQGEQLWPPLALSLPDLSDPAWSEPLSLSNFTMSDWYARMDIPSPSPWHRDPTAKPADGVAAFLQGSPTLTVTPSTVRGEVNTVAITNTGTGILAWRARPQQDWIRINKQGGVALATDVPCSPDTSCERSPTLTITVDTARAPTNGDLGWVDVESLITGDIVQVHVGLEPPALPGDADCDGSVNSVDAAGVLQYSARLIPSLPCLGNGDANGQGTIDGVDALLILQFGAGLLASLPP